MEAEAETEQNSRLPIAWLTAENDSATTDFGLRLHPESTLGYAPDVKRKLKIQAVPAAFLVAPDNTVRSVWVYKGDESHEDLRNRCT